MQAFYYKFKNTTAWSNSCVTIQEFCRENGKKYSILIRSNFNKIFPERFSRLHFGAHAFITMNQLQYHTLVRFWFWLPNIILCFTVYCAYCLIFGHSLLRVPVVHPIKLIQYAKINLWGGVSPKKIFSA